MKNILIVGMTGAGKSSLCNNISNFLNFTEDENTFDSDKEIAAIAHGSQSGTYQPEKYEFRMESEIDSFSVIDTPGLLDTDYRDLENLTLLYDFIQRNPCSGVILCIAMDRINDEYRNVLYFCVRFLRNHFVQGSYCIVVTRSGNIKRNVYDQVTTQWKQQLTDLINSTFDEVEIVRTGQLFFFVENVFRCPDMIETDRDGDLTSTIFHDDMTLKNLSELISWASSRHIVFPIPDDVPLPPQLEDLRHEYLSVIKGKQEEAEHTIGIFNQNLRDMYHLRNTLVTQYNFMHNEYIRERTELHIMQKDDIVDIWFKSGNGIFHVFEEEMQRGTFDMKVYETSKAIQHNCTVTVANVDNEYVVKTVPDFLTVFRKKVKVQKRGAEVQGQWLSIVIFHGDPYEIHGEKIASLNDSVIGKKEELAKLKEELSNIKINLKGKEKEIEKLDRTFKELADKEEFYSRYYFKVFELNRVYHELNRSRSEEL